MNQQLWLRPLGRLIALLVVVLGLVDTASAQIPRTVTLQGILRDASGVPVEGGVDFEFELTRGTASVWTESHRPTLDAGLFTIVLGLDTPIDPELFAGAPVSLVVSVEGEAMDPIPLTSVPYAFRAASAETADSYTGDVEWGQVTGVPDGFADGTDDGAAYEAGSGLSLSGSTFAVDPSVVQARVTSSCPAGQSIRSIAADGTVVCETDDTASFAAGEGLVLTGTTFSVDPTAVQARVTGSCPAGQSIRSIAPDGSVVCEADDTASYAAGSGLVLTGTTFSVDPTALQARVTGSCPSGQAIVAIGPDGTVTCSSSGDPTADTIADDGVIADAEASDSLSISNGLLVAPAAGTVADVNGELRSDGVYLTGTSAPTTYELSTRRYVVDAPPSSVGRVVALDPAIVDALCRDLDGCNVTVGLINWDAAGQPGNVASVVTRMFVSATSRWWRMTNDLAAFDGTAVTEWTPWDCYFGDAEGYIGTVNGRTDAAPGFGLLNVAGGSYSDATTTCRVILED